LSEMGDITSAAVGRRQQSCNEGPPVPAMLPQWAFEWFLRPILSTLFKIFFRLRLTGVENIPLDTSRGLIIAANHQTYFDPFWVSAPVKRPVRYLAWNEAFKWPGLGRVLQWLGAWPLQLERSDPTAIRRALHWLRSGGTVMIFPEGARALADGAVGKFKPGTARIALEANVHVLPVTIRGGQRVWPRGRRWPRPAPVEIIYHPLCTITPQPGEDARQCARRETERLAKIIYSALNHETDRDS